MQEITSEIIQLTKILWDYHHLNHIIKNADLILVMGSSDTKVAERGAELFLQGYAPLILFSGGFGRITKDLWNEPEAEKFAGIAKQLGVPEDKILTENKSTNSMENALFSFEILKIKGINPKTIIVVTKPFMERRAYALFKKQWPDNSTEIIVTSQQISFEDYAKQADLNQFINLIVGDTERIKKLAEKGVQLPQEIPEEVWSAFEKLVKLGYTKQLMTF